MSQDLKEVAKLLLLRVGFSWQFIKHVNSYSIIPVFTFMDPKFGLY